MGNRKKNISMDIIKNIIIRDGTSLNKQYALSRYRSNYISCSGPQGSKNRSQLRLYAFFSYRHKCT